MEMQELKINILDASFVEAWKVWKTKLKIFSNRSKVKVKENQGFSFVLFICALASRCNFASKEAGKTSSIQNIHVLSCHLQWKEFDVQVLSAAVISFNSPKFQADLCSSSK